jgi:hypothetical protein
MKLPAGEDRFVVKEIEVFERHEFDQYFTHRIVSAAMMFLRQYNQEKCSLRRDISIIGTG